MAKQNNTSNTNAAEKHLNRLAELEQEQQAEREALVTKVVGGANKMGWMTGAASAITSLFDAGITSGSLAVASSAFAAGEMFFLKEASERLRDAGKKADWLGAGLGLAHECARDGSRAGALMREQWMRLLMACLESRNGRVVRHADLELLRSLNPPDALLMLAIGRYREKIIEDWHASKAWTWASQNNHVQQLPNHYPLGSVLVYARTIFNEDIHLDIEELEWAFHHRHQQLPNHEGEPLVRGDGSPKSWRQYFQGAPESVQADRYFPYVDQMIDARLTKRAERLVALLVDPRQGM